MTINYEMKVQELIPKCVDEIPQELESGKLYLCAKYKIAIHLCACGCGIKTVTPLGEGEWTLTGENELYTLRPSIGNFMGENPYHAHYYVTKNKIEWL